MVKDKVYVKLKFTWLIFLKFLFLKGILTLILCMSISVFNPDGGLSTLALPGSLHAASTIVKKE